jgi:hypothetical protein
MFRPVPCHAGHRPGRSHLLPKPTGAPGRYSTAEHGRLGSLWSSILLTLAGKAKTYRAEAVIDLPAALLLNSEFLGLLKPAAIGGVDVHVVLPDFSKSGHETVLHSRAQVDWLGSFEEKAGEEDPGFPFGRVFGWGEEREFAATRLLVLPKSRLTRREARNLHGAAEDWVRLLAAWVEVVAREDLHQERIKVEKKGQSVLVWLERGEDPGEVLKGKHMIKFDFSGGALPITPRQWGRILARASAGARPPEAHVFLRDARHARNIGLYRRSVLDSATAAELGLAKLRDGELAGCEAPLERYVRGKAQQIGGLSEFLSVMGRRLPKRIQQEVGDPRNKAIHEGHEPDEETADKALDKAQEVVELAFPPRKLLT